VRLLDDVLKLAKLRSNDPKKYLPMAVNMLKDRLKQTDKTRPSKQTVRFAHTLETLLTATNDEPELITTMLNKKPVAFPKHSDEISAIRVDGMTDDVSIINENNQLKSTRRSTINDTSEVDSEFYQMAIISHTGLTVAELLVLMVGQITLNKEPLKLTITQIEQ
jgi:hypothetical protein